MQAFWCPRCNAHREQLYYYEVKITKHPVVGKTEEGAVVIDDTRDESGGELNESYIKCDSCSSLIYPQAWVMLSAADNINYRDVIVWHTFYSGLIPKLPWDT